MQGTVSNIGQGEYRTRVSGPYYRFDLYNNAGDVVLSQWLEQPQHLDNRTQELDCMPFQQGVEGMATKINRTVTIDGVKRWIHANREQEYADKLAKLFCGEPQDKAKRLFSDYALSWFEVYSKPNIATATVKLYSHLLTYHIMPAFEGMAVEDIRVDDIQRMFNGMDTSKETKYKVKRLWNQVLNAAVDDEFLVKNPLRLGRIKITGAESTTTEVYSVEQMQYLVQYIGDIKQPLDRTYMAIQHCTRYGLKKY